MTRQRNAGKNGRPNFENLGAIALIYGLRCQHAQLLQTPTRHTEASTDGLDFSPKHLADKCRIALWRRRAKINRYDSSGAIGV